VKDVPSVYAIGLNYKEHARELNYPLPKHPILFFKNRHSIQNPFDPIKIPSVAKDVDFEAELAVVIGETCKNVSKKDALSYVLGFTCANDVSSRFWQAEISQWAYAKSFDTFLPLGPQIVSQKEIKNPNDLQISLTLNGSVILTGSPPGVLSGRNPKVYLKNGDRLKISIDKIGSLENSVDSNKD
jgi:2-keto-4-pentenoate hydratase/2-oxohepta-3-ene-1,7-dioic acid hydratase in catechol pathway